MAVINFSSDIFRNGYTIFLFRQSLFSQIDKLWNLARPADNIDRFMRAQLGFETLSHTPEHSNYCIRPALFKVFEISQKRKNFSLCVFSDRAGIYQNHIGGSFAIDNLKTRFRKCVSNQIRIELIHLAAETLDMYSSTIHKNMALYPRTC